MKDKIRNVAVVEGIEKNEVLFIGTHEEALEYLRTDPDNLDIRDCKYEPQTGLVELGRFKSWLV